MGLTSLLSALGTSLPNTTFSQNNGVIALTRCASRMAGIACCAWLILFGVLAKVRLPQRANEKSDVARRGLSRVAKVPPRLIPPPED